MFSLVTLVLMTGGAGLVGVTVMHGSLAEMTDDLVPMLRANAEILQDVVDADTALRAWVVSGDQAAKATFAASMDRLPEDQARLADLVPPGTYLAEVVRRQEVAVADWAETYALRRIDRLPGLAHQDAPFEALGWGKYDRIRTANKEFADVANDELEEAMLASSRALPWVLAVMLVVAVLGSAALLVGRRLAAHVSAPLVDLHNVIRTWAAGDQTARARVRGPVEVRNVAEVLNNFADENTRVRQLQDQVLTQLTAADRAKSDFLSNVSHELRTPLTSISGFLELLEDDMPEQHASLMSVLARNVARLRTLIEDLLTLSSAESPHPAAEFRDVELHGVVAEVVGDLQTVAADRLVTIEVIASPPAWVHGDPSQLSRALLNLLSNAIKFSHPGGRVEVAVQSDDSEISVHVIDEGVGIPPDETDHLGTRFFRASNAKAAEIKGTGLGLRIVRAIMSSHGGRLELSSVLGEGTVSRLVLPTQTG